VVHLKKQLKEQIIEIFGRNDKNKLSAASQGRRQ
jgi:hypothetical protein